MSPVQLVMFLFAQACAPAFEIKTGHTYTTQKDETPNAGQAIESPSNVMKNSKSTRFSKISSFVTVYHTITHQPNYSFSCINL